MTWALARTQLVNVAEAIELATTRGLPPKLKYYPEASLENLPPTRGFFFDLLRIGDRRLIRVGGASWESGKFLFRTMYGSDIDHDAVVDAIVQDRRAIAVRFLDDNYWGRPASSITRIGDGAGSLEGVVTPVPGGQLLDITIPIDFT